MRALRRAAGLALGFAAAAAAADPAPPVDVAALLVRAQALPALRAAARQAGFATAGVAAGAAGAPAPGDQAVALIAYNPGAAAPPEQWLLRLSLAAPGDAAARGQDVTFYSSVGDTFVFHSAAKAAIEVDLLGAAGAAPVHRQVRASADYLMLDISRATAAIHRIRAQIKDRPPTERGNFGVATTPFPPAVVRKDESQLGPYHLTAEDRRSFAGMLPALAEFVGLVRDTPGLQDILWRVLERPSLLDLVRHLGQNPNFTVDFAETVPAGDLFWPAGAPQPPTQLLVVTFQMFNRPALQIALLAVPPRPPLEVTAGVLAAAAWGPSHPERTVVVRVVSARAGP